MSEETYGSRSQIRREKTVQSKLNHYREAAIRAVAWVLPYINERGAIAGSEDIVFGYYKVLPALWTGSRPVEAGRVLGRIRTRFFRDGRFETEKDQFPGASAGYGYRQSWFAIGTHMMGAYDISLQAIATLESDLNPRSGGIGNAIGDSIVDWGTTCCAISALLAGNRVEEAVRAGKLIETIIKLQPTPDRMIMRWDSNREELVDPSNPPGKKGWNVGIGEHNQTYWYLGIALYAFARLYRVTREEHWRTSADRVLEFALACRDDFSGNMNTSKLAWGAAQMAGVTSDPRYRELALHIADWMIASQHSTGIWVRNPAEHTERTQPMPITLDATMDRAFYLMETVAALAAIDGQQ
jgi:hypothetical protein